MKALSKLRTFTASVDYLLPKSSKRKAKEASPPARGTRLTGNQNSTSDERPPGKQVNVTGITIESRLQQVFSDPVVLFCPLSKQLVFDFLPLS